MSYAEEFYEKYERPSVGKMTVGFSGIDPSLSQREITHAVLESMNNLNLTLDSGEIL